MANIVYIPIYVRPKFEKFDLSSTIIEEIHRNGEKLRDNDIIVISSKFVSMSEGRIVNISNIIPSPEAEILASKIHLPSNFAELILREAEIVFGGVPGVALSIKYGIFTPNAGIDRSNVETGYAILYPREPFKKAEMLRRMILLETGKKIGIVITDSRLLPSRSGTTGIAIGISGFDPIKDERGKKDLFNNVLKITRRSIADDISAGVQLLMGEANESIPIVIVRNAPITIHDRIIDKDSMKIHYDECIYVRGLSNFKNYLTKNVKKREIS